MIFFCLVIDDKWLLIPNYLLKRTYKLKNSTRNNLIPYTSSLHSHAHIVLCDTPVKRRCVSRQ